MIPFPTSGPVKLARHFHSDLAELLESEDGRAKRVWQSEQSGEPEQGDVDMGDRECCLEDAIAMRLQRDACAHGEKIADGRPGKVVASKQVCHLGDLAGGEDCARGEEGDDECVGTDVGREKGEGVEVGELARGDEM